MIHEDRFPERLCNSALPWKHKTEDVNFTNLYSLFVFNNINMEERFKVNSVHKKLTIQERTKERQITVVLEAKLKVLSDFANHVGMEILLRLARCICITPMVQS